MPGYLPTLYKKRGLGKQHVCAICLDRTHGRTQLVRLSHGVTLWLCPGHASHDFQRQRGGRDFALTLHAMWTAAGAMTTARSRALDTHLAAQRERAPTPRPRHRPGSYAWPDLRRHLEHRFATGTHPDALGPAIRRLFTGTHARPPSANTLRRWHREQRWLATPAPP